MKLHLQAVVASCLLLLGSSQIAKAVNCASYPYTLTNGQVADANQVMADFNTIRDCGNNNLLGRSNNLSDVTSPATARANLGLGAAAVENLGNSSAGSVTDDGSGNLVAHVPTLHLQTFTSSGVFTVPSTASAATVFKITAVGGGGGGGGGCTTSGGSGGASGGAIVTNFSGFTAGQSVTITTGSGGTGGSFGSGCVGAAGGTTTVSYTASTIVSCTGGNGGSQSSGQLPSTGACSGFTAGGATFLSSSPGGAQPGGEANSSGTGSNNIAGNGGGNILGTGGRGSTGGGNISGTVGTLGAGGGGASSTAGGGTGGAGAVVVEWVL